MFLTSGSWILSKFIRRKVFALNTKRMFSHVLYEKLEGPRVCEGKWSQSLHQPQTNNDQASVLWSAGHPWGTEATASSDLSYLQRAQKGPRKSCDPAKSGHTLLSLTCVICASSPYFPAFLAGCHCWKHSSSPSELIAAPQSLQLLMREQGNSLMVHLIHQVFTRISLFLLIFCFWQLKLDQPEILIQREKHTKSKYCIGWYLATYTGWSTAWDIFPSNITCSGSIRCCSQKQCSQFHFDLENKFAGKWNVGIYYCACLPVGVYCYAWCVTTAAMRSSKTTHTESPFRSVPTHSFPRMSNMTSSSAVFSVLTSTSRYAFLEPLKTWIMFIH